VSGDPGFVASLPFNAYPYTHLINLSFIDVQTAMPPKKKSKKSPPRGAAKNRSLSLEVSYKHLRWRCTPDMIGVASTMEAQPAREIIGQDRALRAVRVGLEIPQHGYNIFVTGGWGTGRTTTIRRLLKEFELHPSTLTDKCYVHNFHDPDSPRLITLPAGKGVIFKKEMEGLVGELLKAIPGLFESRRYQEQRKSTLEHFQSRQRSVLKDFERKVKEKGFEVVQVQAGPGMRPEIAPVVDGNPVTLEQLHTKVDAGEMTEQQLNALLAQQSDLEGQMELVMREMRNIEKKAKKSVDDLNHKLIIPMVEELLDEIKQKYGDGHLKEYLEDVEKEVVENFQRFNVKEEPSSGILGVQIQREEDKFIEYHVNVIVDNGGVKGMPVIIESNPRYKNLFGTIEREVDRQGVWRTDFTHIKAGSIVRADGGFLVVNAIDALVEPGVWNTLKRILRNRQIEIQPPESGIFGGTSALKPEPISLNTKVIMIGDREIYQLLFDLDDDFKKVFKIRADFDTVMPNEEKAISSYTSFIKSLCEEEHLLPFDAEGVCELVEYGTRLAGRQNKLSTRFAMLADVIRESSYWAGKEKATSVGRGHVRKAVDERIERVRLVEEKIQELIDEGSILIDTSGAVIGQVNGLSVYDIGVYSFGKPTRITVKTAMGKAGIINIEREADMSGPTHNKGVLILGGYLRYKYAQNKPLVLSASIAFEQSYAGVDGDSASSTEVYALLSSLAEIPLRQDLAVTGSINQHGEIQPIGGVNQKIEGFFDVCKARGLTGKQGVLIPPQNVKDLMLRHDVVEAVRKGQFHVYAVKTVDEGVELLTGKKAGKRLPGGSFEKGSVNDIIDRKLTDYARKVKKFG
jgi:ATP-dependent Lon protease